MRAALWPGTAWVTELQPGGGGKSCFALRKQRCALQDETLSLQISVSSQTESRQRQQDRLGVLLSLGTKFRHKRSRGKGEERGCFGMGNYSVIFFIRKITHPGTVREWMRQCIQLGRNVSGSLHPGHINKSPFVLGGKKSKQQEQIMLVHFLWM